MENSQTYTWSDVSADLRAGNYIGSYGGCNTAWHALAAIRANKDLRMYHTKRTADEFFLPALEEHINNPKTRTEWHRIATLDPLGLYGSPPTMAATAACMEIPEIQHRLLRDGKVVQENGAIHIQKCAIDYV